MKKLLLLPILLLGLSTARAQRPAVGPTFAICEKPERWGVMAAAGYDYIEPRVADVLMPAESDSTFAAHRQRLDTLGARMISCIIFLPGQLRVTGPQTDLDRIMVWAETSFRRARQLGIPTIVLGSGRSRSVPDGFSREQAREQFIALCRQLGPLAARYGVTVVVEALNRAESNFINSLAEGADIVETVAHPNIRLLCDIYHMSREGEPASEIARFGHLIRHVHIAERERRTAPGIAGDNFTPYFAALKAVGYTGCISIEGNFDDFETRAAAALATMKTQWEAAR